LWQGQQQLTLAITQARQRWPGVIERASHVLTLTAEMVDLFPNRAEGVTALVQQLALELTGSAAPPLERLAWYAGPGGDAPAGGRADADGGVTGDASGSASGSASGGASGGAFAGESADASADTSGAPTWVASADAAQHWRRLASANYLATATLAAQVLGNGVLVDIGSTTSDFIALRAGRVLLLGEGDAGRLATGELVYQGVVRTPLIALAQRVPFGAHRVAVMNELFATSADVYRLTGELDPAHDQHPTADGAAKTVAATQQRLARLLGRDAADATAEQWLALAQFWRERQLAELAQGLQSVIESARPKDDAPLVAAGCGAFLVAELARGTRRSAVSYSGAVLGLAPGHALAGWAQVCAPAVAVARLSLA
jgi:probable H4MPT-linked C1 transfer pathway protein